MERKTGKKVVSGKNFKSLPGRNNKKSLN